MTETKAQDAETPRAMFLQIFPMLLFTGEHWIVKH
jgi:hypothetical protein